MVVMYMGDKKTIKKNNQSFIISRLSAWLICRSCPNLGNLFLWNVTTHFVNFFSWNFTTQYNEWNIRQ